jgi:hypothetical protein
VADAVLLQVCQVQPAPPAAAAWLRRILMPAIMMAGIKNPPPLEVRPCGLWGGWCENRSYALDGRVSLSSKIVLWTERSIISAFIHECAHRLLPEGAGHDARFFALQWVLFARIDQGRAADAIADLLAHVAGMYDLQDAPAPLADQALHRWLPRAMAWALDQGQALAVSELTAEASAAEIDRRYAAWVVELEAEPARAEQAQVRAAERALASAQAHARALEDALESRATWRVVALTAMAGFFFLFATFLIFEVVL